MDKISIANRALGMAGGTYIASLDASSNKREAQIVKDNMDPAVRYVLSRRDWSFATKRVKLTAGDPKEAYGSNHRFKIPTDYVAVRKVYDTPVVSVEEEAKTPEVWWTVEGGYIISDSAGPLYAKLTTEVTDLSLYSAGFEEALVHYLAAVFTRALNGTKTKADTYYQLFELCLGEAAITDVTQRDSPVIITSGILDSR